MLVAVSGATHLFELTYLVVVLTILAVMSRVSLLLWHWELHADVSGGMGLTCGLTQAK